MLKQRRKKRGTIPQSFLLFSKFMPKFKKFRPKFKKFGGLFKAR